MAAKAMVTERLSVSMRANVRYLIIRCQAFCYDPLLARPPAAPPIGLRLARTARAVTSALERALAEAGGSVATWQVLVLVRSEEHGTQARLAEAMGVPSATLTPHLGGLEKKGLVRRWREEDNRRVQRVALTPAGEELFDRLRKVAMAHDRR